MNSTTIIEDSSSNSWRRLSALFLTGLLAASVFTHSNDAHADLGSTHTSLISEFASFNTPGTIDGRVEAIAVDGDTVYVGGNFTQIQNPLDGDIIDQPYLFAYSKSSGNIIRDFNPRLDNRVFALETTGDGNGVFAGGQFTSLNGERNLLGLLKIDDSGDRVQGFDATPNGRILTMVRLNNTLYVGGRFETINRTSVEHLAALDTTSGAVSPRLNLNFEGTVGERGIVAVQGVNDIDITSDGQRMVVAGAFESIDGNSRPRLSVLELSGQARVSTWNTNVFDEQCPARSNPQSILGVDIAPDDSYFITGSSGFREAGDPACDSVVRFDFGDLNNNDVQPTWVNYTGGDSIFDVVSTDHAIYVGGHFRWLTNDTSIDGRSQGPGSQVRRGLAALDPLNGLTLLDWRSDRNPRGRGTFALISEDEGLYIGDDTDFLNGTEHRRLKFLPITSDTIERPDAPSLPTTIVTPNGNALDAASFDGNTIAASAQLLSSGWRDSRAGVFVGGQLFHADDSGNLWMSQFANGTFQPRVPVDLFGLTENNWALSRMTGMFFDYDQGRVYYTLEGNSRLLYRAFTPDGPYFGNDELVAEQQGDIPWGDVSGMDVIDGRLYYGRTNGSLFRANINGAAPVAGTTRQISGPGIDRSRWDNELLAFIPDSGENFTPVGADNAQFVFESSGSQTSGRFRTFEFPVVAGEPVDLRLEWLDPSAQLRLFVRDSNDNLAASDTSGTSSPIRLLVPAGVGGTYTAAVLVAQGSTSYTLEVNPVDAAPAPAPVEPAPPTTPTQPTPTIPLAEFEFSASGTDASDNGRFQTFNFDVEAGDFVEGLVTWDDQNADVGVFLRNENGIQVDRNTNGRGSATVSTTAATSGRWSIGVSIRDAANTVNYDVQASSTSDVIAPSPQADFEFSSSGGELPADGRFQTFNFDVVAGETVDAQIVWDDPDADVRVFLRDENGTQIDRELDGNSSAGLSAVATSSGRWSVAVLVGGASGTVNYEVLVDTSGGTAGAAPGPRNPAVVANGSFENPFVSRFQSFTGNGISGWSVTSGNIEVNRIPWPASDGDQSISLNGNAPGALEQQITNLTPGATYTVMFDFANHTSAGQNNQTAIFSIEAARSQSFNLEATTFPPAYRQAEFDFVAAADGTATIGFASTSSGGLGIVVDDLVID